MAVPNNPNPGPNRPPFLRVIVGVIAALLMALVMNFYLTQIAPNNYIQNLAHRSKSPFLMIFFCSLILVGVGWLVKDVYDWFANGKKATLEQVGMVGTVVVAVIGVSLLTMFQDCREPVIQFTVTQSGRADTYQPGGVFVAHDSNIITVDAKNLADPTTAAECLWTSSISGAKVNSPALCQVLVKRSDSPTNALILTLTTRPPSCRSQFMAPLTISWQ